MSTHGRPSTLDGIKRHAKKIGKQQAIAHHQALDIAAHLAGFQNFKHAHNSLSDATGSLAFSAQQSAFHAACRAHWVAALNAVDPKHRPSVSWHDPSEIMTAVAPFLGGERGHMHLPSGGGRDFDYVVQSRENGCIEFRTNSGAAYLAKPDRLHLERIDARLGESFLLLELAHLELTGVYDEPAPSPHRQSSWLNYSEEVVDVQGEYMERSVWDQNHLGYDETGHKILLPDDARLVTRWLQGKFLLVAKGSFWNGIPQTYDGQHTHMTARDIRDAIEDVIRRVA